MANYAIKFFGWCKQDGHDKVWGWVEVGADKHLYNFWGRRGKRYTFKDFGVEPEDFHYSWEPGKTRFDDHGIQQLIRKKTEAGRTGGEYIPVDPRLVETVAPGFDEEFQNQFALCKLFDKFHGKTDE